MQIMKVGNWYFVADKFGAPLDKEVFQHEHQAYEHLGRLLAKQAANRSKENFKS